MIGQALSSRTRRWLAILGALALLLLLGEGLFRGLRNNGSAPGAAEWIWMERAGSEPVAFYAIKDFELDGPASEASLTCLVDEEYLLRINGRFVGANRYTPGAPLDLYSVARYLHQGSNRLWVEARSRSGLGGLILRLEATVDGRPLEIVSDSSWSIVRRHHRRLSKGIFKERWRASPLVWGRPPVGRWGIPEQGPPRPVFAQVASRRRRRRAQRIAIPRAEGEPELPTPYVLLDWGSVQMGYLQISWQPQGRSTPPALVTTGLEPLDLDDRRVDNVLIAVPKQATWMDSTPRRFRYALVQGLDSVVAGRVFPIHPRLLEQLVESDPTAAGDSLQGVFGMKAPVLRSSVEDKIRRRLEGVPRVAGRKAG